MRIEKEFDGAAVKGSDREKSVPRSFYFTNNYFSLPQLFSFAQQIHEIHAMKPKSILEVGIGNGFVSTFLSRAGYAVKTADINPSLNPDICAPLDEVHRFTNDCIFDVVVCCEVLEHMPLEELENNIKHLKSLGHRLFLTLPNYKVTFGLFGFIRVPKVYHLTKFAMKVDLNLNKKMIKEHFWEVGSCRKTSKKEIINLLKKYYNHVESNYMLMFPYHIYFKAS